MIIFHQTESCRSICQYNAGQPLFHSTVVCLAGRTRNRDSCRSQIAALGFARISGSKADQLIFCKCIDKFLCFFCIEFCIFPVYNCFCRHRFRKDPDLLKAFCLIYSQFIFFCLLYRICLLFCKFFLKRTDMLCFCHDDPSAQFCLTHKFRRLQTVPDPDAVHSLIQHPARFCFVI